MLEPIVITPLAQWMAAAFCVGAGVGFIFGWLRGICDETDRATQAAKQGEQP